DTDGKDRAAEPVPPAADWGKEAPDHLLRKVLEGGIVGLGGAVFPTAQKLMQALSAPIAHLLVNGVECEPYISCDDMLMRERAADVVEGARILMHALGI